MKKEFMNLPDNLKVLVEKYWDKDGVQLVKNPEVALIIDVLKKNVDVGFPGFKLDMGRIFEKEQFSDNQLDMYYKVHLAGVKNSVNAELKEQPEVKKPRI